MKAEQGVGAFDKLNVNKTGVFRFCKMALINKEKYFCSKSVDYGTIEKKGLKRMRLDKYLKVSRIIKRRTVSNDACDAGRVLVNGRPAKAGYQVKQDDVIQIPFGQKQISFRVIHTEEKEARQAEEPMFEEL